MLDRERDTSFSVAPVVRTRPDAASSALAGTATPRPPARLPGLVPVVPMGIIAVLLLAAVLAPWIAPHDPMLARLPDSMIPPAWSPGGTNVYPLGTDGFGRDQLSRVVFGARISLGVAAAVLLVGGSVGTVVGLASGYLGGWVDAVLMRLVDMLLALPLMLLAILLAVIFGPSLTNIIVIVSVLIWPRIARQVRGEALSIRRQDFVVYSELAGVSTWKVVVRHVFPHVAPTLLVLTTLEVGSVILLEASLSFLGAGIPAPQPSWGVMVADGRGLIATGWWISLIPGLAILVTALSFNILGDWLRDRLDPTLRGS